MSADKKRKSFLESVPVGVPIVAAIVGTPVLIVIVYSALGWF